MNFAKYTLFYLFMISLSACEKSDKSTNNPNAAAKKETTRKEKIVCDYKRVSYTKTKAKPDENPDVNTESAGDLTKVADSGAAENTSGDSSTTSPDDNQTEKEVTAEKPQRVLSESRLEAIRTIRVSANGTNETAETHGEVSEKRYSLSEKGRKTLNSELAYTYIAIRQSEIQKFPGSLRKEITHFKKIDTAKEGFVFAEDDSTTRVKDQNSERIIQQKGNTSYDISVIIDGEQLPNTPHVTVTSYDKKVKIDKTTLTRPYEGVHELDSTQILIEFVEVDDQTCRTEIIK